VNISAYDNWFKGSHGDRYEVDQIELDTHRVLFLSNASSIIFVATRLIIDVKEVLKNDLPGACYYHIPSLATTCRIL
jgi:hypothetical protein